MIKVIENQFSASEFCKKQVVMIVNPLDSETLIFAIPIQNLKCSGCAATITNALKAFPHTRSVEVNSETETVHIESTNADAEQEYRATLIRLGYPPVGEDNTVIRKAKSYVSCALGKIG